MKQRPKFLTATTVIMSALALSSCAVPAALDVVGRDSIRAFGDIQNVLAAEDEQRITAPDGGAWLEWDNQSVSMVVDAEPFIAAGLDISLLDNLNTPDNNLVYTVPGLGRDLIGYHMEMDHYNISLGDGNMFEWAKDINTNGTTKAAQSLDIVFVLNPEPFIAAGVDPTKLDGWSFEPVEMMGNSVNKFLKPVDIA